ncbi:MAG TPA: J domain-containing protein [Baekduia sp.]|uniref:J domain-containing protein n=1 Tax=Baekduia sp. TaxID=2600305 RepID=UPI002C73B7C5|nr:J domain-containing protein [Baekduia sp.]HMJ35875.1 J domain-containing protein [Baekduia sp.]
MAVGYRDYYDALGVSRNASTDEIRAAYRRLAREHHPDVNKEPEAGDRFKEISEAYEVLRDEDKRKAYDRFGENWKAGQDVSSGFGGGAPGGGGAGGAGTAGGPFGGGQGFEGFSGFSTGGGAAEGDFSDFFESLFGGGRASSRAGGRRRRGADQDGFSLRGGDQEATIDLTVEEAYQGGTRHFQLSDGRDYEVTIPPGVREGQRIRLAGEGGPGVGGGPSGDLFLRVHLLPHPRFRLLGRDVEVDLPVAPWEAALGATVPVGLLDGGTARVKVKGGSSSGTRLRLRGEGWPDGRGQRGDLYAVVKVMVPKKLSKRERALYKELADVSDFDPRATA